MKSISEIAQESGIRKETLATAIKRNHIQETTIGSGRTKLYDEDTETRIKQLYTVINNYEQNITQSTQDVNTCYEQDTTISMNL